MAGKHDEPSELLSQFDSNVVAEIVARTRAEQGFPPTISDPAVLARLAVLVQGAQRGQTP